MSEETNSPIKGIPEVKFNKNGYEIRTEILEMAQNLVASDFNYKWLGWELSVQKDDQGRVLTKVDMPEYPGLDAVLQTAEKMYNFVQGKK